MLTRLFLCLILSCMLLLPAAAQRGVGETVTVETNLAHKEEAAKKERKAGDRVWSAVVLATNPETPKPIPGELRPYEISLKKTFGYNQFEIMGAAIESIDEDTPHWLAPVHNYSLEVKASHGNPNEPHAATSLRIQLFQLGRSLVTAEIKLPAAKPLIIRGPECGKGELIIILQVQH